MKRLIQAFRPAAVVVTLALIATPAFAQHERESNRDRQQRGEQSRRGQEQRGEARARGDNPRGTTGRVEAGRRETGRVENSGRQGYEGRAEADRRETGRVENSGRQRYEGRAEADRGETGRVENSGRQGYEGRAEADRRETGRVENSGREGYEGRAVPRVRNDRSRAYVEPRAYGYGRPHVEVRRFNRPYYVFRPHFVIGYGIYIGYPVPYPVVDGYPTYVYGSPYDEVTAPAPGDYGGISFDITPDNAAVSVDGAYVGVARDFSPSYQPLTLTPGRHHIELQAEGMEPLAFDVDVPAGEVLPYRGALRPY